MWGKYIQDKKTYAYLPPENFAAQMIVVICFQFVLQQQQQY